MTILTALGLCSLPAHAEDRIGSGETTRNQTAERVAQPSLESAFTLTEVRVAIGRAIEALYRLEPNYTFRDVHTLRHKPRGRYYQNVVHEMGNQALACWAMLAAGEPYQSPKLHRRINWVLSGDQPYTYDRSMRAQMLAELPTQQWRPWIRRETMWLTGALTDQGNFAEQWTGDLSIGLGDNANGQYGALGLWACARGGFPAKVKLWRAIDEYWRSSQEPTPADKAAGWAVESLDPDQDQSGNRGQRTHGSSNDRLRFYRRVSGPMTAGGVATLALTERYLRGAKMTKPGDHISRELKNGLRWLDEHFSLDDPEEQSDWYFYMWTIQRVGHATGYRNFNGIDWHREATRHMLDRQDSDGTWTGPKGTLLSTGFAVLYLSQANTSLAISKLRFDGNWNSRPHDLWNFADYVSQTCENHTTWQIVNADLPVQVLVESPLLLLACDGSFRFNNQQIKNLRDYIHAGGLILTNADQPSSRVSTSLRKLVSDLFDKKSLKPLDRQHELYRLHQHLVKSVPMQVMDNGIRPLMIHFGKDIGSDLQSNDHSADGFAALSNIYLYSIGMTPTHGRLENNYVTQHNRNPQREITVARIRHDGTYDPEPLALPQLKAICANEHDIDLHFDTVTPDSLSHEKLAFMTVTGDAQLSDEEATAIRRWIDAGGTLWLDAAGGGNQAVENLHAIVQQMGELPSGQTPLPLSQRDPIITGRDLRDGYDNSQVRYRLYALHRAGPLNRPRLLVLSRQERPAIILSEEDLTCGLAGLKHWGIWGYEPKSARQLVLNGILSIMQQQSNSPPKS